jgi:two-component system NtrC family response regulator
VDLPPLRGRVGDILDLFMHYMRKICDRYGLGIKGFSPEFLEALLAYDWPGNVRELVLTLERALTLARDEPTLYRVHLPPRIRVHLAQVSAPPRKPAMVLEPERHSAPLFEHLGLKQALEKFEREYLDRLMSENGGKIKEACSISGLSRTRLYERLRKHGIRKKRSSG